MPIAIICKLEKAGEEIADVYVERYPRIRLDQVEYNRGLKLLVNAMDFPFLDYSTDVNPEETSMRVVFKNVALICCATCRGTGSTVLFQAPEDCRKCNGLGAFDPFGQPITLAPF